MAKRLNAELELGMEVEDRITGYKGIAVARTHYLQGCDRLLVQAKGVDDEGKVFPPQDFDEPDVVVIGYGVLPKPELEKKDNGGPRPYAARRDSSFAIK